MIGSDDLSRLSEEYFVESRIGTPLYCAECGYNLLKLPYMYTCPECGSAYDARPLVMEGIFFPHHGYFPFGDIMAILISLVATLLLAVGAVEKVPDPNTIPPELAGPSLPDIWQISDPARLGIAIFFLAMAFVYLVRAIRQFRKFLKRLVVGYRIANLAE